MWICLADERNFHQFAMFNTLGTLYTKLYNQRNMADRQGLRLVTAIPRMQQCGHRMKTGGEPPCIKKDIRRYGTTGAPCYIEMGASISLQPPSHLPLCSAGLRRFQG